jgi:hypothetical protein
MLVISIFLFLKAKISSSSFDKNSSKSLYNGVGRALVSLPTQVSLILNITMISAFFRAFLIKTFDKQF